MAFDSFYGKMDIDNGTGKNSTGAILPLYIKTVWFGVFENHFTRIRLAFFRVLYHLMDLWYNV